MGLYLCVFEEDEELDGVEVGGYADFEAFRSRIASEMEGENRGSRFPTLMLHSDSDGEWAPGECQLLKEELQTIGDYFKGVPCDKLVGSWQKQVGKELGLRPINLYESYIDVDGEPLLEGMIRLCNVAITKRQPILFQ